MSHYDDLRQRHFSEAMAKLPGHVARLGWPAERIAAERELALRRLLAVAARRSPWHRARLAAIDFSRLTTPQLLTVPPMTKADLLAHFDRIVTDPRVTLRRVEAHLERLTSDSYLLDEHHAIASGGSSGVRGVYVYDWDGWATYFLSAARWQAYDRLHDPALAAAPPVEAIVAADKPTHGSVALSQTFSNPQITIERVPITAPVEEIVGRLNNLAPTTLRGYPSALEQLSHEAQAGRLLISPLRVRCVGEPLLPETRVRLEQTWNVPVQSQWVASEAGTLGYSCPTGRGMHLNDDLVIVEPVGADGQPVPPGTRSAKIYITNLFNTLLPLLRFEITDEITVIDQACPCGSAHTWIEDVQGRLDDQMTFSAALTVHPIVVRSPLGRQRNVAEYQVHQTRRGVEVLLRLVGDVDLHSLQKEIASALAKVGLTDPEVRLTQSITSPARRVASSNDSSRSRTAATANARPTPPAQDPVERAVMTPFKVKPHQNGLLEVRTRRHSGRCRGR